MISDKIDGRIEVGKIHANPFKAVVIKDIAIIDTNPFTDSAGNVACDTLFRAEYITATFGLKSLLGGAGFHLNTATVENAMMYLSIEPGDSISSNNNLKRIFRLKKRTEEKEKSDKEVFSISKVRIRNMAFLMENFRKDQSKFGEGGINWFDMEVRDINISGRKLRMRGPVMSGLCDSLSFREKSGYVCRRISGDATVGNGKTSITSLHIADNWSDIYFPEFVMTYENTASWSEFVTDDRTYRPEPRKSRNNRILRPFTSRKDDGGRPGRGCGRIRQQTVTQGIEHSHSRPVRKNQRNCQWASGRGGHDHIS